MFFNVNLKQVLRFANLLKGRNNEIYVIHSFLDAEGLECWELLLKQYYVYEELNENIVFDNEFLDFKDKKNVFDLDSLYVRDKLITDPIVRSIIKDSLTDTKLVKEIITAEKDNEVLIVKLDCSASDRYLVGHPKYYDNYVTRSYSKISWCTPACFLKFNGFADSDYLICVGISKPDEHHDFDIINSYVVVVPSSALT